MWNDTETTNDLLNFRVVADTAARVIQDSGGQPISIGVSGSWGTGKSSLVKMIGVSLKEKANHDEYLFIEFNAWLYQGYDDARMALLQTVADRLLAEAEKRETCVDDVKSFISRINWLRVGKLAAPAVTGAMMGGAVAGPAGALIGAVGGLFKGADMPSEEEFQNAKDAFDEIKPELRGLLNEIEPKSLPKEISALRDSFADILENLNVHLVVLVDDLDRCLPPTAISTLEAMRLLLFLPRSAFIIAADEEMIRNAVRVHFGDANVSDGIVTSYFDKLIQIPLRVPRLGIPEVKTYLILLLTDRAARNRKISQETFEDARIQILKSLNESWNKGVNRKTLEIAFGDEHSKINREIDLADQLAPLMANADQISGNPRLIKRFLNDILIRDTIAKAKGISLPFDELVKVLLFERCASPAAFEYFVKTIAESDTGKPEFLNAIESSLASGNEYVPPTDSWDSSFIHEWLRISPPLADIDLRPLLHLSKDRSVSLASYDELSPLAQSLLEAIIASSGKRIDKHLVTSLKELGESEGERVLNRLTKRARAEQFSSESLIRALHLPHAYSALAPKFASLLRDIPAKQRKAPAIPLLSANFSVVLSEWEKDTQSPKPVVTAIKGRSK